MITRIRNTGIICLLTASIVMIILSSCQKNLSASANTASSTIAVAASESAAAANPTTAADSVYVVQPCARGYSRNPISATDLPSAVTAYLTANYSGYTFSKAFSIVNSTSAVTAYVVIIYYNDKPVGILFDSAGNFVKVLEQRDRGDLDGKGWHDGGRFCDRNGLQKDTIAINALPSVVLTYMAANYPQDTLTKAFRSRHDSSYVVVSKNNGLFATVFDANGNFVKRITLPAPQGSCTSISQSDLPSNVAGYLGTTYPNYVFEKAFAVYRNGVLQGYVVVINANNTKYAVRFDASGNFVAVKTIW